METLTVDLLHRVITKRPENSHKGTFGHIVIVGGSTQYGGAVMMCAKSCIYSGAGLVSVATDPHNHAALHAQLPEAMVLDWQDQSLLFNQIKAADVVVIGPGMGTDPLEQTRLLEILARQEQQLFVIDGSAITMLAKTPYAFNYPERVVFTPHQKEWERLSKLPIDQQTDQLNKHCQEQMNSTVVVKSHRTTIYSPTKDYQNPLGNPGMATGGMGDTLAGIIGSFLAQFSHVPLSERVAAAVLIHSYIGDQLAKTQYVVLPTAITASLPETMKFFSENEAFSAF